MAKTLKVKGSTQQGYNQHRELLLEKAREIRQSMPSGAEVLARREQINDVADLAGQSHEEWIFLNRNAHNASLLKQVSEALERVEEGTYGICADCNQPISAKRLEVMPWAKYCVPCQEKRGSWTN